MRARSIAPLLAAIITASLGAQAPAGIQTPEATFGFKMGADRELADWAGLQRYFETVAAASDRVEIVDAGPTTEGRRPIAVDWYRKWKGTEFEGTNMPWLYHRYAGHDINRDAFMMNMAENRSIADFFYRRWHPQVFLTMHQMGPHGPRFFVPPNTDPIDRNYDLPESLARRRLAPSRHRQLRPVGGPRHAGRRGAVSRRAGSQCSSTPCTLRDSAGIAAGCGPQR